MSEPHMYVEAFVEDDAHGYRWRVYESDPGLIHIEYQEWDDEAKRYVAHRDVNLSFSSEYADLICAAIKRVKDGV